MFSARIILPQGFIQDKKSGSGDLETGFRWFQSEPNDPEHQKNIERATDRLMAVAAFRDELEKGAGKPIVVGLSAGAMLTFDLALRYGDCFKAALPVAGPLPGLPDTFSTTVPKIWAYHGKKDNQIRYELTEKLIDKIRSEGHNAQGIYPDNIGHTIPPEFYDKLRDVARSGSEKVDIEC
jgi:predicted esterase